MQYRTLFHLCLMAFSTVLYLPYASAGPPKVEQPLIPSLPQQPIDPVYYNQAPTANYTITNSGGVAPVEIAFNASSSTDDQPLEIYDWQFGDGNFGTGRHVQHVFNFPGSYFVELSVTDVFGVQDKFSTLLTIAIDPDQPLSQSEAARFLSQSTFGPTMASINNLQQIGFDAWIEQQQGIQGPHHINYYTDVPHGYSLSNDSGRHEKWWLDAIYGEDQLRNRVAFALSQVFVTSDVSRPLSLSQLGMTHYYDLLRTHAFGNYRELLEVITLNPVMGIFLSMAGNERADSASGIRPDENYAREVLQLFSIGIYRLNLDGTPMLDSEGKRIPNYNESIVREFARVFTGWDRPGVAYWQQPSEDINSTQPMDLYAEYHDNGDKRLLYGLRIPAGQTPEADLTQALDNIFLHPNVAPFFSKQLIQRLVTSSPTPAYVERVAHVFNDNGDGIRGDLGAVVRAILLDQEARYGNQLVNRFGKLREPLLRLTHQWRAFNISPGNQSTHGQLNTASPGVDNIETLLGQKPLGAASVFNFYSPTYSPVGPIKDAGLFAPEFEIFTDNNILETANRLSRQVHSYSIGNGQSTPFASYLDLSLETTLAANPGELLDHLDVLLLSGQMTSQMRTILLTHLNSIDDTSSGHFLRARDAINLILASPDYLIQM